MRHTVKSEIPAYLFVRTSTNFTREVRQVSGIDSLGHDCICQKIAAGAIFLHVDFADVFFWHFLIRVLFVSANFFDSNLGKPVAVGFDATSNYQQTRRDTVEFVETTTFEGLGILSLLMERGGWSGQIYQPRVNHRECKFSVFTTGNLENGESKSEPLLTSMFDNSPESKFDQITPISVFFYEVGVSGTAGCPMTTLNTLSTSIGDQEKNAVSPDATADENPPDASPLVMEQSTSTPTKTEGRIVQRRGFLENEQAYPLTRDGFKRLCHVLGKNTTGAGEVTLEDQVRFMDQAINTQIKSAADVSAFLAEKELECFFSDEEMESGTVSDLLQKLGFIIRSLCPVRIAVPEGQHRMALTAFCTTGYFDPSATAPLSHSSLEESPHFESLVNCRGFEHMQIHGAVRVRVITPAQRFENLPDSVSALSRYGDNVTAASSKSLNVTLDDLVVKLLEKLKTEKVVKTKIGKGRREKNTDPQVLNLMEILPDEWGYHNFWGSSGKADRNTLENVLYVLFFVMATDLETQKEAWPKAVKKGGSTNDTSWEHVVNACCPQSLKQIQAQVIGKGLPRSTHNQIHVVVLIIRFLCMNRESMNRLERFLVSKSLSEYEQGHSTKGTPVRSSLFSMDFLVRIFRSTLIDAFRPIHNKCLVEAHVIHVLMSEKFGGEAQNIATTTQERLLNDPKTNYAEALPSHLRGFFAKIPQKTAAYGYFVMEQFQSKFFRPHLNHLFFAMSHHLIDDIIATFLEYGADPIIREKPDSPVANRFLRILL